MVGNIAAIYREYVLKQNTGIKQNYPEKKLAFQNTQNKNQQNSPKTTKCQNLEKDTTNFTTQNFLHEINKHDKAAINKEEILKIASSPIAPIRRALGIKESTEHNNQIKTVGLALLAINNLPMDLSDINSVLKQIKKRKIAPNPIQTEFTFTQDTLLEFPLRKLRKRMDPKTFDTIYDKIDKSLFNTKLGQKIVKMLNLTVTQEIRPNESIDIIKNGLKQNKIYVIKGKSKIAKLICRSMMRIPILSIAAFSLFEIPDLIKATKNETTKDKKLQTFGQQFLKSCINIVSMIVGMSTVGSILDRRFGAIGSLIGIGLGNYLGEKTGTFVNNKLFENTK